MSSTEPILEIRNLNKSYAGFQAVRDLNLTVFRGDVYGFLGPNGAGKSTTIRCLLSLIKPDSGSIRVFGKDLFSKRAEILSKIGCIVEKPDFYKYLSAEKNLEFLGRISGADVSRINLHKMLDFVGLQGREKDKVGGFSHGMKQRLGIAQALLHNPEFIVLDEPTTGLDPQGIIDIRNLILRLRDEQGKTVLLSSHILPEIELISNRMVIVNKGSSVAEGSVDALLKSDELTVVFEVENTLAALPVLDGRYAAALRDDTHFEVLLKRAEIPRLTALLQQNGISVYAIESRRKLEDYFLKLLQAS